MGVQDVIEKLLGDCTASRVTVRETRPNAILPVTFEAIAPGVLSIREVETPKMTRQPVAISVLGGQQVVQNDCISASDKPYFKEMLELYGGLRAQIVTPIVVDGTVKAILSLHQLGRTRIWTKQEMQLCLAASAQISELLSSD